MVYVLESVLILKMVLIHEKIIGLEKWLTILHKNVSGIKELGLEVLKYLALKWLDEQYAWAKWFCPWKNV